MSNASNFLSLLGRAALTVLANQAARADQVSRVNVTHVETTRVVEAVVAPSLILEARREFTGKNWICDRSSMEKTASNIATAALRSGVPANRVNLFKKQIADFSNSMFFDSSNVVFEQYLLDNKTSSYRFFCNGNCVSLTF